MAAYLFQQPIHIKCLLIFEPHHSQVKVLNNQISFPVVVFLVVMNFPIELDDQLFF